MTLTPAGPRPADAPNADGFVDRIGRFGRSFHPAGLAVALLFFCWSMTPSLLPRVWYLQGVATGISLATGYGIGVLAAWLVRRCGVTPSYSERTRRIGWLTLLGLTVVAVPTFLVLGSWWQQIVRDLAGVERINRANYLLILLLALVLAGVILTAARGIRRGTRALTRLGGRYVPVPAARLASVALVIVLAFFVVNGLVYQGLIGMANRSAAVADQGTADGVERPSAPERSGSPASPEPWESLGQEGRTFVAGGPTADQITTVTGRPALTPIRAYAGRESAETVEETADLVVAELERTGAFDRSVVAVATTTGRGWVNARVASALEYTTGGDSAIAAMQYSFLPSPLSFIADRSTPLAAGRALFEAVERAVDARPEDSRPRLVTFGESLGSFGGQGAFGGAQDMLARTDGALWVGTPNFSPQWGRITEGRDAGSPERLPVVDGGANVRFAASAQDLEMAAPWGSPRIVYWQHASDPITWWSFDLLLHRPDWLREPLGPDVDPGMRWIPFVTFWQVTMDMVFSADVPAGHGHTFGEDAANMWAGILEPDGWTDADTEKVRAVLAD
ncbi:alpha/beta hydrolase [Rhodococcus sp. NPDC058514]|uniref:alpha/beta hydrolase n=1 Tax=unclassified Rhodococcus (in: high G+C Gram-positive bacteria) TaxID=192944 RepID=UPI0036479920